MKYKDVVLNIGDVYYGDRPVTIKCHGLGSCVALFLFDTGSSTSAGAHIMLPGEFDGGTLSPNAFSQTAVAALLLRMRRNGIPAERVRAKIVGGANVVNITSMDIGSRIVETILHELERWKVIVLRKEVGGTLARAATFSTPTRALELALYNSI